MSDAPYAARIAQEGLHWANVTLDLIRRGIVPYCCDFRLHLTQLLIGRSGLPFHLGAGLQPTRFREVRNVLGGAAQRIGGSRGDVLDVGCGGGWLSLELARQGGRVRALDVSEENLRLARLFADRHPRSLPYLYPRFVGLALRDFGSVVYERADLNADLSQIKTASCDVATVWDSLHHVRDLEVAFREIARALRADGLFIGHDYLGGTPEADAVKDLLLESVREIYRKASSPELAALRRHVVAIAKSLPLQENAVDDETVPPPGAEGYIEALCKELQAAFTDGRPAEAVASPFEEVSITYLLTELERRFEVRSFYTCHAYQPEDMPPPPEEEGDLGGLFFHYLSYLFLIMDDLLIDSGAATGRYLCFAAVPRGSKAEAPPFARSAPAWLDRLATPGVPARHGREAALAERVRFLQAENRILRRLLQAPAPAADAHRFYFKFVRPILLRLTERIRRPR